MASADAARDAQSAAVLEAARWLAAHASERVRLGDVADHVSYSPFHLARCFERQLGAPPGEFLAAHRFQRAKRLLLAGDDRTVDVCFAVGFQSLGTFTGRFGEAVGVTPSGFRRLPDRLADAPARPLVRPGPDRWGGAVRGRVALAPAAAGLLGPDPAVYVGVFPRRLPRGAPVSGARLAGPGEFVLGGVPTGRYWVLACALPGGGDPVDQLLPPAAVVGAGPRPVDVLPVEVSTAPDVVLDLAPDWMTPVVVALPALALPGAQDPRSAAGLLSLP
ncbi:MAG TPA: AraC family transcriptional regulator [Acidimicrobiales bacterium]|nr:AraC family transcriptional regulator [Acidimicrobiales bacterium]